MSAPESVPIAALQHFAFCPRQCAYIHTEQRWSDNYLTAKGNQLHERVHTEGKESRRHIKTQRGVRVQSFEYNIHGQLDLLEIDTKQNTYTPVEYKHGRPKQDACDRIQLCAQALCLEEMLNLSIEKAALWYWKPRKREWVTIDEALREQTKSTIRLVSDLLARQVLPPPSFSKVCKACSFFDECQPQLPDTTKAYIQRLYE